MKKYCLSDCAKRKLSAGKKVLVEFVTAISFVGLIVANRIYGVTCKIVTA